MVTIGTFEKPEEAYLVQSVLEGSGVPAFVEGDLVVNVAWMYSNAIGGVKVQVLPEDAERAREVLDENIPNESPERIQKPKAERRCLSCGSGKIEYQKWSPFAFFITLLLLGAPLPFLQKKFSCLDCGRDWNPNELPSNERIDDIE